MGALAAPKLSVEEYLAIDRKAECKSEYHDGELFPISGVSWEHARLSVAPTWKIAERLQGSPYSVAAQPIRVRVAPICGRPTNLHR
jgi:hypothetical protein